jgi:peroxiredoxin
MKMTKFVFAAILFAVMVMPASAQDFPAPNISGMAVQGVTVNLNYFRGDKNVLVVFYRMHNWPYCQAQLVELQSNYEEIQSLGAEVVALSADIPTQATITASELRLTYPILSDSARTYIREYGVLHPQEGIARPSLFILNREGLLAWNYVGQAASDRPAIETVLEELRAIQ